jgi:hypothetical protein
MDENRDNLERRCPRLGHEVRFQYCRLSGDEGNPCWKTLDCWWEYFDVLRYLRAQLPEAAVEKLLDARPKPKTIQLVELIAQAQQRLNKA